MNASTPTASMWSARSSSARTAGLTLVEVVDPGGRADQHQPLDAARGGRARRAARPDRPSSSRRTSPRPPISTSRAALVPQVGVDARRRCRGRACRRRRCRRPASRSRSRSANVSHDRAVWVNPWARTIRRLGIDAPSIRCQRPMPPPRSAILRSTWANVSGSCAPGTAHLPLNTYVGTAVTPSSRASSSSAATSARPRSDREERQTLRRDRDRRRRRSRRARRGRRCRARR